MVTQELWMWYYLIMDANKRFSFKNQKGQALVEFMLFLPFMLMLYSTVSSIGNAINGSINQQKITRAYFYYRAQNNSMLPKPTRGGGGSNHTAWSLFGMEIMGWREKFGGGSGGDGTPVAPCYKFNLPLGDTEEDSCEEGYQTETTQYIRVGTVYGVCATTYANDSGGVVRLPGPSGQLFAVSNRQGCEIR
jgi:hypothetical protein